MADFYAPQYSGLAAFIQPYLSWREKQVNESKLADLMLPRAIPVSTLQEQKKLTFWPELPDYRLFQR